MWKENKSHKYHSPKQDEPEKTPSRHVVITMANTQEKERILKDTRKRQKVKF